MSNPFAVLLSRVIERGWVYSDRNSKEKLTGKYKTKFKLADYTPLGEIKVFPFYVLTSSKEACSAYTTEAVKYDEWETVLTKYFPKKETSYIDVKKIEVLSEDQVIKKRGSAKNGFKKMARLPESRFKKLSELKKRAARSTSISSDVKEILKLTTGLASSEEFVKKFKI